MTVCSLPFLFCCLVLVITFQLVERSALRRLLLGVANLAFLATLVPNKQSWAAFVVLIGGSYLILRAVRARPSRAIVLGAVASSVVLFMILKQYTVLGWILPQRLMSHHIEIVGISYMLFKFIHVLVDAWQGQIASIRFSSYANYQLSFFTLLAGPIQRYNDFHQSWVEMDAGPVDVKDTWLSWSRVLTGFLKMGLLAPLFWQAFQGASQAPWSPSDDRLLARFAACYYSYPFFLYLNFSGYTDVAIGSARLLGFRLPENFNYPFLARNVIDYWNRWHISLSHWIRDYVFMTSYKYLIDSYRLSGKILGPFLLFFALFVSGGWHGSTLGYAIFGALHGLGAAANQVYGELLKGWLGRPGFQLYQKNRMVHLAAILLTFHFTAFCFLFFSSGAGKALAMLRAVRTQLFFPTREIRYGLIDPSMFATVLLVSLILWGLWKRDMIVVFFDRAGTWLAPDAGSLHRLVLAKTVAVTCLLLAFWVLDQKEAVVVYMRF